jgi:hypothetical protein
MHMKNLRKLTFALALAGSLCLPLIAQAQQGCGRGRCERRPYGDYCRGGRWGRYGARDPVKTAEEARKRLEAYYADEDVEIGRITERELHFEAEVKDKGGDVVDRVIVDKRSGRIRSIY